MSCNSLNLFMHKSSTAVCSLKQLFCAPVAELCIAAHLFIEHSVAAVLQFDDFVVSILN